MARNSRKTNSRSVDNRRDNFLESSELLRDARLEIEGELELGIRRHDVFPVLSVSGGAGPGKLCWTENIRPEICTSHLPCCDVLESRPVLSLDQNLVTKPLGDGLLPECGSIQNLAEPLSQGDLAAGNLDRPLQSSNVRFIHNHARYTTRVVSVNNLGRVPDHKAPCIVLKMPAKKQKQLIAPAKTERVRVAVRGADGLTFGERLQKCMDARSRAIGREYRPKDLRADATRLLGRDPDEDPICTQQALSLILKNKVSESHTATAFAKLFEVESMWLQYGIGPATYLDSVLRTK